MCLGIPGKVIEIYSENDLKMGKVDYSAGEEDKPYVVVDGNLVTGRDPFSSELFAQKVHTF